MAESVSVNVTMLLRVVDRLAPLLDRFVFLGGAVTELFITVPGAARSRLKRPSQDLPQAHDRRRPGSKHPQQPEDDSGQSGNHRHSEQETDDRRVAEADGPERQPEDQICLIRRHTRALQMPIATTTPIQNRIAGGMPPSSTNAAMISSPQNAVWAKSE